VGAFLRNILLHRLTKIYAADINVSLNIKESFPLSFVTNISFQSLNIFNERIQQRGLYSAEWYDNCNDKLGGTWMQAVAVYLEVMRITGPKELGRTGINLTRQSISRPRYDPGSLKHKAGD
jgi:hypothetical protein